MVAAKKENKDPRPLTDAEQAAIERFLLERFQSLKYLEKSSSSYGISFSRNEYGWNYHDESWTEIEEFDLRRISQKEFEEHSFSETNVAGYSRSSGINLKRAVGGTDAECYFNRCGYSRDEEEGFRWTSWDEAYVSRLPCCEGPFFLRYREGNDRD